ncbi:MAG: porin family protein [Endomicrobia bacterium]|nr:porin family protein [Endomicrobiia bacterium]
MKKLGLAVLAVVFMAGSIFAEGSEMKIKIGLDTPGTVSASNVDLDTETGIGIALEFLFPVSKIVKFGPAIGYSFAREIKLTDFQKAVGITKETLSFVPIYATAEINPIKSLPEIFFKGNFGFNFGTLSIDQTLPFFGNVSGSTTKFGMYYGLGAGYNFPFGLFLDVLYSWNNMSEDGGTLTYSKFSISAGYRFDI